MSVSEILLPNLAKTLVSRLQLRIGQDGTLPDDLFTNYAYVSGKTKCCHRIVVDLIQDIGRSLQGVERVSGNKVLHQRGKSQWKPDIVLWKNRSPVLVVEYESLNSSDNRVLEKDLDWYSNWAPPKPQRVPLLLITTLPDFEFEGYRLRYTSSGNYNFGHNGEEPSIRRNPFQYWYGHYWEKLLDSDKELPVTFANFSGKQLMVVKEFGLETH